MKNEDVLIAGAIVAIGAGIYFLAKNNNDNSDRGQFTDSGGGAGGDAPADSTPTTEGNTYVTNYYVTPTGQETEVVNPASNNLMIPSIPVVNNSGLMSASNVYNATTGVYYDNAGLGYSVAPENVLSLANTVNTLADPLLQVGFGQTPTNNVYTNPLISKGSSGSKSSSSSKVKSTSSASTSSSPVNNVSSSKASTPSVSSPTSTGTSSASSTKSSVAQTAAKVVTTIASPTRTITSVVNNIAKKITSVFKR
jgi:hypothetical protein